MKWSKISLVRALDGLLIMKQVDDKKETLLTLLIDAVENDDANLRMPMIPTIEYYSIIKNVIFGKIIVEIGAFYFII